MIAKILVATDLHKHYKDFTSIKGSVKAVTLVQADLINYIRNNGITHFISTGDWYDRGYRSIGRCKSDDNIDRAISDSVKGNAYITLGNHLLIEKEDNPELYMIQPNSRYKPFEEVIAFQPIFQAVDSIMIGKVQISFFHFNKENKEYIYPRNPEAQYHLAVYHDDCVVPTNIRDRAGYFGHTSISYLDRIYSNVDLAIIGHIHTKIGMETLTLNSGKVVPLIIPGSLCVTQNKEVLKHKSVQLPIIVIDDNSVVRIDFAEFSTHMECMQFYGKSDTSKIVEDVRPVESTKVRRESFVQPSATLREYISRRGYSQAYISTIDDAVKGVIDTKTLLQRFGGKDIEQDTLLQEGG